MLCETRRCEKQILGERPDFDIDLDTDTDTVSLTIPYYRSPRSSVLFRCSCFAWDRQVRGAWVGGTAYTLDITI